MHPFPLSFGLGCALAFSAAAGGAAIDPPAAAKAKVLGVGDPAPAFRCGRWVKGKVEAPFKPGHFYVVELWATWCGPCKLAIPHLTEMAREYTGKVTFIGVDVLERGKDPHAIDAKVDAFVREMGARMDYPVCRDSEDSAITESWFHAARENGIPTAFVVDGGGRIAWIGNPLVGLDDALPAILAGTFDAQAFNEGLKVQSKLASDYRQAMKEGDHATALALVEQMKPSGPKGEAPLETLRLGALVHLDEAKAELVYARILHLGKNLESTGSTLAWQDRLDRKWYLRSIELLRSAPEDMLRTLAKAQLKAGLKADAKGSLERYIAWARGGTREEPGKGQIL